MEAIFGRLAIEGSKEGGLIYMHANRDCTQKEEREHTRKDNSSRNDAKRKLQRKVMKAGGHGRHAGGASCCGGPITTDPWREGSGGRRGENGELLLSVLGCNVKREGKGEATTLQGLSLSLSLSYSLSTSLSLSR